MKRSDWRMANLPRMTSLPLKMILLFRQACAMSGHPYHAANTTFRACAEGPLSGAAPISQTDPLQTFAASALDR